MNRSQLIGSAKEMNRNAWFEECGCSGRTLRGRDVAVRVFREADAQIGT